MNIPKYQFNSNISIVNIGDVHRGADLCDVKLFSKVVQFIKKYPRIYWVSTGDLLDVALTNSISGPYEALSPDKEYRLILEELSMIRKKCLGIVESNHLNRIKKMAGLNLDAILCRELKVPYLGTLGIINVTCKRTSYYLTLHHGVGFGRQRGSKTANTERLSELVPCSDIYLEGHTHTFDYFINEMHYIDRKRCSICTMLSHFVVTGHYLNWEGSYGQTKKLRPMPKGSAIIELKAFENGRKKVSVDFFSG